MLENEQFIRMHCVNACFIWGKCLIKNAWKRKKSRAFKHPNDPNDWFCSSILKQRHDAFVFIGIFKSFFFINWRSHLTIYGPGHVYWKPIIKILWSTKWMPFGKFTIDERAREARVECCETATEQNTRAEKPLSISLVSDGGSELIDRR